LLMTLFIGREGRAQVATPAPYKDTTKVNYVREWTATAPEQKPGKSYNQAAGRCKANHPVFRWLGQGLLQRSRSRSARQEKIMVTAVIYDSFGREQYNTCLLCPIPTRERMWSMTAISKWIHFNNRRLFQLPNTQEKTFIMGKRITSRLR